ncbi:MAG TPA: ATPase, T2SS/T4P/T4SS family [Candidatus Paceibacterota bacterium]|nr:ATPase, T2SS/T4P/T4SS family [Candidatus Paceibacterota bacterium]
MNYDTTKLKDILLRENYVTKEDIEKAQKEAGADGLINYLLKKEIITNDLLGQAIAEALNIPYANLNSNFPSREQVLKIPEDVAKEFRAVLFSEDEKGVVVATDNPTAKGLSETLSKIFKQKTTIAYGLPEDIDKAFTHYRKALTVRFTKILEKQEHIAPEILDEIFKDAFSYQASDIHFEPQGTEVVVRLRIDGVLQEAGRISKEHYENILNRIKVTSGLRIDEHFAAQDGSLHYKKDNLEFDLRTSIVPTIEGEKVVLRILSSYVRGLALADLGFSEDDQSIFEVTAKKPFGMILVAGPTGSGKTTTLYSLLRMLNQPRVNITTIEDPVEYKLKGINQIQVSLQTNLTFAKGLRSIVRQDPDIILVGEIRDKETAEIAVNAALTGHLLLSTFHANDAATAIPRLLDMGIQPFLLSSTLELIVAQRLVRQICKHCRHSVEVHSKDIITKHKALKDFFSEKTITLYQGKGCDNCGGTGYKGRTAVFELIRMTKEMQELILKNPSRTEVWQLARKQSAKGMFEDGIEKVKNGVTTLEELERVVEMSQD